MNSINNYVKFSSLAFAVFLGLFINACGNDDPPLPDNLVTFETATAGLDDDDDEIEIKLNLARAVDVPTEVTITLVGEGVLYDKDFTTTPAATNNTLTVTVPAASATASFNVVRTADKFWEGTEKVTFTIAGVKSPSLVGPSAQTVLSFSSIVSTGDQLTLNGLIGNEPGTSAGNAVYVDFSSNTQKAVARTSWDLGFFSGDDFRVILNNTAGSSAVVVNKTEINSVSSADVTSAQLTVGSATGSFSAIDTTNGTFAHTAIAAISATDSDNKVYVINRIGGTGAPADVKSAVKVRIIRNGSGYTLQHAKIDETTFKTVSITKDAAHTFSYVSLDNGAVSVEPEKNKWDIQWTWSVYFTGPSIYSFSDLVFINQLNGVSAAEVLNSQFTFDEIKESDLSQITFRNERNVIGSNWRVTAPPATPGVKTDRFYLIKDSYGNVYKLKFISFHASDGGTRGKPVIKYTLLKKG